LLSEMAQVAPV